MSQVAREDDQSTDEMFPYGVSPVIVYDDQDRSGLPSIPSSSTAPARRSSQSQYEKLKGERFPNTSFRPFEPEDLPQYIRCIVISTDELQSFLATPLRLPTPRVLAIDRGAEGHDNARMGGPEKWIRWLEAEANRDVAIVSVLPEAAEIAGAVDVIYRRAIERIARPIVRRYSEISMDQMVEEVCELAARKLHQCKDSFAGWVAAMCRERCNRKKKASINVVSLEENTVPLSSPPATDEVEEHLQQLPKWQREAIRLKHYEGLSSREIAEQMNVKESTVRSLNRADRVEEHLQQLPRRQREAIRLKYYKGLSNRKIAEQMKVKLSTVLSLISRAENHLKGRDALSEFVRPSSTGRRWPKINARLVVACVWDKTKQSDIRNAIRGHASSVLVDKVHFVSGWFDLIRLVGECRAGCPILVDVEDPDFACSGVVRLRRLRRNSPNCRIVAYGGSTEWSDTAMGKIDAEVVKDRGGVGAALVRATDREGVEGLVADLKSRYAEEAARDLLEVLVCAPLMGPTLPLTGTTVKDLSQLLGISNLRRECKQFGLPGPKSLLNLVKIFHVSRLAEWSGETAGPIAKGVFGDSQYARSVGTALEMTPTELTKRGGLVYVRDVVTARISGRDHPRAGRNGW